MIASVTTPICDELVSMVDRMRPRTIRSCRQFAEDEIIIPDGPFKGLRFRVSRQPCAGLWFDAVDSGQWARHVLTAPSQSGKTLAGFVIPILWHLFEWEETVVCMLPMMEMASDKWQEDIKPAIEASRYRELLPRTGAGSKGGRVESIRFRNGTTLKFVSGGGSDKKRAGFTSRVVVITETDGMDEAGGTSREADKIEQIEARTRAYGSNARIYMECTVSTETGRTWREYTSGTQSRIAVHCRGCRQWVCPEREHLVGWQDAETETQARAQAAFSCPECGELWTEDERAVMNKDSLLLHKGQSIDQRGRITGDPPEVGTLGFRWHAFHNLLMPAGQVAADEWRAARASDEDNAEKKMRQFVWALPYESLVQPEHNVEFEAVMKRVNHFPRQAVPTDATLITAGVDVGKWLLHWVVCAWSETTGSIIDYGRIDVPSADMPLAKAIMSALRQWQEIAVAGFARENAVLPVTLSWVDSGYETETVYQFCREAGNGFNAAKGFGASQRMHGLYRPPTRKTTTVKHVGDGYHIVRLREKRTELCEINADHWKTWLHDRLSCPVNAAGAVTLFRAEPREHLGIAKHFTAEQQKREFEPGKGERIVWERKRPMNHWFDAAYLACAAGHMCGVRLMSEAPAPFVPSTVKVNLKRPDGRSFFVTNR